MQPYFMPYAGYLRLFAAADLFVVYDCVQFPRRGWVHRNRLADAKGELQWLTLPLQPAGREVRIADLHFREGAQADFDAQSRRFPALQSPAFSEGGLREALRDFAGTPVDYLERTLRLACASLGVACRTVRSSSLAIPEALRAQDRIIAIVKALGGTGYVNSPGGTALYSAAEFASHGIELRFLPEWRGDFASVLQRLCTEPRERIAQDIFEQCATEPAR